MSYVTTHGDTLGDKVEDSTDKLFRHLSREAYNKVKWTPRTDFHSDEAIAAVTKELWEQGWTYEEFKTAIDADKINGPRSPHEILMRIRFPRLPPTLEDAQRVVDQFGGVERRRGGK